MVNTVEHKSKEFSDFAGLRNVAYERGEAIDLELGGSVITVAAKRALAMITGSTPLLMPFKAIGIIAVTLILTAVSITIFALGIIYHLVALPFTLKACTVEALLDYTKSAFTELSAVAIMVLTFPIKGSKGNPEISKSDKMIVVMAHGYGHNSSAALAFQEYYKNKNIEFHCVDLGSPFQSMDDIAGKIKNKIDEIVNVSGPSSIHLIGHSMGGLASLHYAHNFPTSNTVTVKSITTLASPIQGTKMTKVAVGKCAKQMSYGSEFIEQLKLKMKDSTIPSLHFGSETDMVIRPTIATHPANPCNATCYTFSRGGHTSYLYSRKVAERVEQFWNQISEP